MNLFRFKPMTQRSSYLLLVLFLQFLAPSVSAGLSVSSGVDRDTVSVGDLVSFQVRVFRAPGDRVEILPGEGFPGIFEIRSQQAPVVRRKDGARVEETRGYLLAAYETGAFELPSFGVVAVSAAGDTARAWSEPVRMTVRSVRPDGLTDILDIKPPVEVEATIPPWIWSASVGFLGIIAAAVYYLRRKRREPILQPSPSPIDWGAEVMKIAEMGLIEKGDYRQFYTKLSELFRRYLEAEVGIEAMERTTPEIAADMDRGAISEATLAGSRAFLSEADLVKFAKFRPPEGVVRKAAGQVLQLFQVLASTPTPSAETQATTEEDLG